jgi:hypothetical protein
MDDDDKPLDFDAVFAGIELLRRVKKKTDDDTLERLYIGIHRFQHRRHFRHEVVQRHGLLTVTDLGKNVCLVTVKKGVIEIVAPEQTEQFSSVHKAFHRMVELLIEAFERNNEKLDAAE